MEMVENQNKSILLEKIIEKKELIPLVDIEPGIEITNHGIYRAGYEFAGFFQCELDELQSCIHIIGRKESQFLKTLSLEKRVQIFERYFSYSFPAVVLSQSAHVTEEFFEIAKKYKKPVLRSQLRTSETIRELKFYLSKVLGAEIILNGYYLLEIFGVGVLLTGDDDVKIGAAIELLERGHKFITDNNLRIRRNVLNELIGYNRLNRELSNPHFFIQSKEHKIDLTNHFGIKATRTNKRIDMIIHLEKWDEKKFYDRLGLDEVCEEILEVKIQKLVLPVKKGRNLAVIIEAGAMNTRLKKMGENSAKYFWEESKKLIKENKERKVAMELREKNGIPVEQLIKHFNLNVIYGEKNIKDKFIKSSSLHKPSLALSGYFGMYQEEGYDGIQVFSEIEFNFLDTKLSKEEREKNLKQYLSYKFPLIIVTDGVKLPDFFLKEIENSDLVVVRTDIKRAAQAIAIYNLYLENQFKKSISVHGVFLELYGFGVLLTGKSGIGKSETALELIHRGHRLIADDLVKFTKDLSGDVIGKADKLPYFMEVRGLGIIDIKALYGLGAVRIDKRLDLVIELKESLDDDEYLTGIDSTKEIEVVGTKFDKLLLYISSGRNAAAMVEIAVMNVMAKKLGYDPEKAYEEGIKRLTQQEREKLGL